MDIQVLEILFEKAYEIIILVPTPVLITFVILVLVFGKRKNYWFSRHNRNIRQARKILKKIRSWGGENLNARIFSYLRKIDPFVFEELLLESFKDNGYVIKRNKRYTGDGGIDGVVYDEDKTYFVQAKRYKNHINKQHIVDFSKRVTQYNVNGFFIHTGRTGKESSSLISQYQNIELISGSKLITLMLNTERRESQ